MRLLPLLLCCVCAQDIICSGDDCYPKVFVPTNEWQIIKPDQEIPAGLHVRLNIDTLQKEAKLMATDNQEVGDTVEVNNKQIVEVETEEVETKESNDNEDGNNRIDHSSKEYHDFETSINEVLNSKQDIHKPLDTLVELCHDINYGIELVKYSDQLMDLMTNESLTEKILRIIASSIRNNDVAIQYLISQHPKVIQSLSEQLPKSSDLIKYRILGIFNGLAMNTQFKNQYSQPLINDLVMIYPSDDKCATRIGNILQDWNLIPEGDTNTEVSKFLQVQLMTSMKTEAQFKVYYNKLVELHESDTELKPQKSFVAWLDQEAGKRSQGLRERDEIYSDADKEFDRKMIETRHLVFGNPNALRKHDEL